MKLMPLFTEKMEYYHLYRGQQNYIVSENGATYSNLTYK